MDDIKLNPEEVRIIKPEPSDDGDYFTAYTNGALVVHTFFDFQIHFAEIKVRDINNARAETFATIMMSPQHAKAFLAHLAKNVEMYEAKFGEINIPKELLTFQSSSFKFEDQPSEKEPSE